MTDDDDMQERLAALSELEQALQKLVGIRHGTVFLTGWALAYEYTSSELEDNAQTGDNVVVPQTQSRATSRGLFDLGKDVFVRAHTFGG